MHLQKTILTSAFYLVFCCALTSAVSAQQVADIPHINSKIIVDGYADDLWNLVEEHPITFLVDGKDYPSDSDCSGNIKPGIYISNVKMQDGTRVRYKLVKSSLK